MLTDTQQVFRDHLISRMNEFQTKNPRFSQRAFALRLGVTSGALSGILSGKRQVSAKMCSKLLDHLGTSEGKKQEILRLFEWSKNQDSISINRKELSDDVFSKISTPGHFNVLTLLQTENQFFSEKEIQSRIDLSREDIQQILQDLLEVRCIYKNEVGRYLANPDTVIFGDTTAKESIQQFHCDTMDEAKKMLRSVELELRDFRSLCIPAAPEKVEQIKDIIKKFRDEVTNLMGQGKATEVYKLNIQFYPVTTKNS